MIATHAMLLDFINNAGSAAINAIVPDAAVDKSIANCYSIDYGHDTPQRRKRRKLTLLERQFAASLKRGTSEYLLNEWKRIERETKKKLNPTKRARI